MNLSDVFEIVFPENISEIKINYTMFLSLNCASPKKFTSQKVILLSLANIVACGGVLANLILVFLFSRKPMRQPIMAFLSGFDCFLCLSYIAMFGNEALGIYFRIKFAYDVLFQYLPTMFFFTKIDQLCIPLMLIAGSMQKWAFLSNRKFGVWRHFRKPRGQLMAVITLVSLAVLGLLPKAFGIVVHHYKDCPNYFLSKEIWSSEFSTTPFYGTYILIATSSQVFGCFFILLILNAAVVFEFRKKRKHREDLLSQLELLAAETSRIGNIVSSVSTNLRRDHHRLSEQEREAVLTLAIIVTSYLVCNSFHVALTCLENWATSLVYDQKTGWTDLTLISTDLINFLFMLTSAIRLLIHLRFNHHIRQLLLPCIPYLSGAYNMARSNRQSSCAALGLPRRKYGKILEEEQETEI